MKYTLPGNPCLIAAAALGLTFVTAREAGAQTIDPFYASTYSFTDLGTIANVPANYGGLTFKAGDPNTLLIGGSANVTAAKIYSVPVTRDPTTHQVTSFGAPTVFADANSPAGGIDGGLTYGPGNVLFYTSYSDNYIGQLKTGSTTPDKLTQVTSLGVASSVGSLVFVPAGFGGAGRFKILSYNASNWYDTTIAPDGTGTYNINPVGPAITLGGGLEGAVYIKNTNPLFANDSVLVDEYGGGRIVAYDVDANGDPIVATRRDFITGLSGAEGATIDPVTGDFLFSTFGGGNRVIRVQGFLVPEPSTIAVVGVAAGSMLVRRRKRLP